MDKDFAPCYPSSNQHIFEIGSAAGFVLKQQIQTQPSYPLQRWLRVSGNARRFPGARSGSPAPRRLGRLYLLRAPAPLRPWVPDLEVQLLRLKYNKRAGRVGDRKGGEEAIARRLKTRGGVVDQEEEGKGRREDGETQSGEKIGQRPQVLSDFRFGFPREKAGAKGISSRRRAGQTLRKELGGGVSGLLSALGDPDRPAGYRPTQQPPALDSGGTAPGRQPRGRRLLRPSPGPGWRRCGSLASLPFIGGLGTWDDLLACFNQLGLVGPGQGRWAKSAGALRPRPGPHAGSKSPPTAPSVLNSKLEDPEIALKEMLNTPILRLGPSRALFYLFGFSVSTSQKKLPCLGAIIPAVTKQCSPVAGLVFPGRQKLAFLCWIRSVVAARCKRRLPALEAASEGGQSGLPEPELQMAPESRTRQAPLKGIKSDCQT